MTRGRSARRLLATTATGALLAMGLTGPAQAVPEPAPRGAPPAAATADGLLSYVGKPVQDATGRFVLPQGTRSSTASATDARRTAERLDQHSFNDPLNSLAATDPRRPPVQPGGPEVEDCLNSDGARSAFGRVYNRFMWCQRWTLSAVRGSAQVPGGIKLATMDMDFSAVAYGRDDGNRGVTVFFRGDSLALWPANGYIRADAKLYQRIDCEGESGCGTSDAYVMRPLSQWMNTWHSWTIDSDRSRSTAADLVLRHKWSFEGYLVDSFNVRLPGSESEKRTIRCDSATIFGSKRRGACIFDDVTPHLQYSVKDPKVDEVAEHIRCAQEAPYCATWPAKDTAKLIPGKFVEGQRNDLLALHRVRSAKTNSPIADANRRVVRAACAKLPTHVYDTSKGQECDEYPFASTKEGAACCDPPAFDWDYSILGVSGADNNCAGQGLKAYYRSDRILYHQDGFFVRITDTPVAGPATCDVTPGDPETDDDVDPDGGGPIPVDHAPTANAGPDVSGDEGRPVVLRGSASDPELGTPNVAWGYRPVSGVDPGASCSFGDGAAATTTVSCTDDGVWEVTIHANDGVNPGVSDSALVTLHNVAPGFGPGAAPARTAVAPGPPPGPGLSSPQPWQVFRAGTAVPLVAAFTEPAENDTHTCVTNWDDGSTTSYPAVDLACQGSHTFAHPGMYTIRTTVTDDDGGSAGAEVLVIVYDPDAGFATAGGHLASPAGAITGAPTATGQGHFQFNPKYLPHDEGPAPGNGKVRFDVKGTSFRLADESLEWLVVTPDDRIAVKGTATVDGRSGYGFVAYGHDADPDGFRLVAWPLSAGAYPQDTLSYDNRPGADYDVDVADPQAVDSGSIQAHH
ncbi:PKD domain-containing protein [Micromonospora coxensis]|uniref:Deoxyribonuclease NucA/NucB n=1 Tax=Micromonospora coxensis TaxID=356852 RepID=A0A1C5H3H9_9ACTN|nr:PKD domain-containing protein [Micromonospora coxensis]SCG39991.1 Deoxyribonuclease NucA/NucB [Micromonospora coxensis]